MNDAATLDSALPADPAHAGLRPSTLDFLVVGLGASAGGMPALTRFFEQMPPGNGMAFVVVLHLSPVHESHAASILQRCTAMPVQQVAGHVSIQPNHVYVIPPGKALAMEDGHLHLVEQVRVNGRNVAIDNFFRMLAEVHASRAVSIVLSGTGTDGSVGLTRIKERGGLTLAQAPDDAEHQGMPNAAIATGMVDFVLPVAAMPAKLVQLANNAGHIWLPADAPPELDAAQPGSPEAAHAAEAALATIMNILRARTHCDFRHYKRPTVLRRLERRMQVTAVPDLTTYRDYLQDHSEETSALLQDMLISVTNFFRDRDAFNTLEHDALPGLYGGLDGDLKLRGWVVGCASGEEAYSLAMVLQEMASSKPEASFQLFASDIDERALTLARAALYPGSVITDVPPARMRNFMLREQDNYRVVKSLRERVLFANHNVLRDPPFSRLDLISCRNLLIYLDRTAQAAVLEIFRFALKPGGVLFLGSSESPDVAGDAFIPIHKKHHIYRLNPDAAPRTNALTLDLKTPTSERRERAPPALRNVPYADVHQRALEAHAPASVLVDSQYRILHMTGGISRFLQVQGGAPSQRLLDNVRPALRLDLRTALFQVRPAGPAGPADGTPQFSVESKDAGMRVKITVQPLRDEQQQSHTLILVLFDELPPGLQPQSVHHDAAADGVVRHWEAENQRLQQRLQDIVEHGEASGEELMSSNEELQAVNEELRSATEELETSREELQSTNEELMTVNTELALRVEETGRINDDLRNLINATDIATIFVDRTMRIQRYTPLASQVFNLIASDVGRSLLHITNRLNYAQMLDDANTAFQTLRPVEREVLSDDGRAFIARVLPYRTGEDRIEGATLSFVDVTTLRQSQSEARAGHERLRDAVESTRDFAIITTDGSGFISSWNAGAQRLFGYSVVEVLGRPIAAIFTDEDRAAGVPARELEQARLNGRAEDERWHRRKDGSVFYCSGVTTRLDDSRGFAKIARDLTGSQKSAVARELLLSDEQAGRRHAEAMMEAKEIFLAVMSHELKHPLNLIHINAEVLARLPEVKGVPAAARAAGIIQQTVAGQARIIDDLLDLSRARTGKLTLDRTAVNWGETVRRIVDAVRTDAEAKDVALHFEPGDSDLHALFDPVRAEQVVWNLLSNALKFTPKGGSVRAALAADGDDVRLTVTDTGRGIDHGFIHRVFDMFTQEPGPNRREETGMGIGLALVRELVQAHGGRVQVRSAGIGHGAEFSVWVPLHQGAPPPAPDNHVPSVLRGLRVLVVDDTADSAQSFALLLGLTGAQVTDVTTGDEALAKLAGSHFDLLVSDISMPGMSGLELIAAVRARAGGAALVALACSGYGRAQDERSAIDAGFDALISKPAALEQVERTVAGLLAARAGSSS